MNRDDENANCRSKHKVKREHDGKDECANPSRIMYVRREWVEVFVFTRWTLQRGVSAGSAGKSDVAYGIN